MNPTPLAVEPVPCLQDNYAYLVGPRDGDEVVVVDASEAEPVLAALRGRRLAGILCTHHHYDHVGGHAELKGRWPELPIYGHADELASGHRIPHQTHGLADGEALSLFGVRFVALHVPGHTQTAVSYYCESEGLLFTGDTLFACGCGRLFEGTPPEMHASLSRLLALPPATQMYCGHEYAVKNLGFALAVEPQNAATQERLARVSALRERGLPSVPSSLAEEAATNPFVRAHAASVAQAVAGRPPVLTDELTAVEVFARVRAWRNTF